MTHFFKPTKTYLVCATPRSGSTLLCEMLRETGRAGVPLEHFEILRHSSLPRQPREYFQDLDSPRVIERLAPVEAGTVSAEAAEDWWARILAEGSTDNGVWGGKIMWGHTDDFVARARELPGLAGADLDAVLAELLGEPQVVFVSRRDKAAQAVSLWRAVQTQSWRSGEPPNAESVVYDFEGIDHLVSQLEIRRAVLERVVRSHRAQATRGHLRPARFGAGAHGRVCAARLGTSSQHRGGPAPHAPARRPVGDLDRALPPGAGRAA